MFHLIRSGLILLLFAIICEGEKGYSQTIPINVAARNQWLEKNPNSSGSTDFKFDRVTEQGNLVIFERFQPSSFIILLKSEGNYLLAGYSSENLFYGSGSPAGDHTELLRALSAVKMKDFSRRKGSLNLPESIGPLIHTKWGQGKNFNYYCPRDRMGPNGRVYVGCVAVAMGQIVRYYGLFNGINLEYSYNSGFYGVLNARIGSYDWAAMNDSPASTDLQTSDLLRDMGVLVKMCYGASCSTANSHRALEAFHEMGYMNGIILRKSKFSAESWSEIFFQNLSEYKPLMVTGGGHAFVCDGYDANGFFHFNLGWDGSGDGFYPLGGVLNMPVNEAFAELEPVSWPEPPCKISSVFIRGEEYVTWAYKAGQQPMYSRIYANDRLVMETGDTLFSFNRLTPGIHQIMVSAVYPYGESRWIGPVQAFVRGAPLSVPDPVWLDILQKQVSHYVPDSGQFQLFQGDLSRIEAIEIDQPIRDLTGIEFCRYLERLTIHAASGLDLDAGQLEKLERLEILDWEGRSMIHPEAVGKLRRLKELRIRNTPVASFEFLKCIDKLMKFEYSGFPVEIPDSLPDCPFLEELILEDAGIRGADFVLKMPEIHSLDLSGNELTGTGFLSSLKFLEYADLSDNHIVDLLLTDQLQSLTKLDASDNDIFSVTLTTEMNSLNYLDLSGNKLTTPGRFLLYTPVLKELNLKNNQLRDMGKQRIESLEILDVSYNQLITTNWVSLQPHLKKLELEHNRISDLSGLTKNNLYRQLEYLGVDRNPISRESFTICLPILEQAIDCVSRPLSYQPFSPCYVVPEDGGRLSGNELNFEWFNDAGAEPCVYDFFIVQGDSMVTLLKGLDTKKAFLRERPAAAFSWGVAARTADSVYYSGIYDVISTAEWSLPFRDGFETYVESVSLDEQSDFWFVTGETRDKVNSARIVTSGSRTGIYSLALFDRESAVLSAEHLYMPYLSIKFSVLVPPGQHASFSIFNMNGMYIRLVWDASNTGRVYVNDKIYSTFTTDHFNWMDYDVVAHARNNNIYIKSGKQLLINAAWQVPEGLICAESIIFSGQAQDDTEGFGNKFYIDDVNITSSASTLNDVTGLNQLDLLTSYPNPFCDQINLSFSEPGIYQVSIIDGAGREVHHFTADATINRVSSLSLGGLMPGLYSVTTGMPEKKILKILKIPSGYFR